MPREIKSKRQILEAVEKIPGLCELLSKEEGHFHYEIDLEVMVYGRNYAGKMVGPYLRLLEYEPGEAILSEGDWGGNTFYYVVAPSVDVFVTLRDKGLTRAGNVGPGLQFGEMSILAGVPRSATIRAPETMAARVLEVQRPALRLLRKIPEVNQALDGTYRKFGKKAILSELRRVTNLTPEWLDILSSCSRFRVFSRNHTLISEGTLMNRLFMIRTGWMRRFSAAGEEDILGKGSVFGLEGLSTDYSWPYSVVLMERTELLEISISKVRKDPVLTQVVQEQFTGFMAPPLIPRDPAVLHSQKELTETGLANATNLLVMDMALCVRCGNCSLACHKVHGNSRLMREGIHVTRLKKPGVQQSVISPAVCMHCKDPECMTGCPTGAIGRFEGGQVDITPRTCIGCGDCATQCPYNAISLIPRRKKEEPKVSGWKMKMHELLRIQLDPLPPAVDATEDLVAVKCNLCQGTTLNPKGSKSQAFSCEENCPTGALARINPKEYFNEIGSLEGLAFQSPTQAIGKNIHVSDPTRRMFHAAFLAILALFVAGTIFGLHLFGLGGKIFWFLNMRWVTGLIGLFAIIGVMLYPARRQIYVKRAGALRYWLQSHAYLGALAAFIIFVHGGTDTGGLLTTALMISFDLVIFTGIYGILCYFFIPRMLTKIEDEPLLIDSLLLRRKELRDTIGKLSAESGQGFKVYVEKNVLPRFLTFGYLLRQYFKKENLDSLIQEALAPFQPLEMDPNDKAALNEIITSCVLLRRVDALIYLHRILKSWLPPHVITTSLMLALMIVHIIQVSYFAWR